MDVNLLLESLKREDTQVGAWVNVVGSTEGVANEAPGEGKVRKGSTTNGEGELGNRTVRVRVKAVMLWSAGAVRLGEYEEIVHARKELGKH